MRRVIFLAALVAGCVSTEMKGYVGRDVSELMIAYGPPRQIIELPDGRRAYQFRGQGGAVVTPGSVNSTYGYGSAHTTVYPAAVIPVEGCLMTFIAVPNGTSWTVSEIRVPKGLVC